MLCEQTTYSLHNVDEKVEKNVIGNLPHQILSLTHYRSKIARDLSADNLSADLLMGIIGKCGATSSGIMVSIENSFEIHCYLDSTVYIPTSMMQ